MNGQGKVVCVTGASGYIASWVVKLLLLHGYTVNATVRNLSDPKKVEHLAGLEGAKERLHLFKSDLIDEGSFDAAVRSTSNRPSSTKPIRQGQIMTRCKTKLNQRKREIRAHVMADVMSR